MATTIPASAAAIGGNRLASALDQIAPRCVKAAIDRNPTAEAIEIFFLAIADVGLTQETAADRMVVDPALLSRVKHGTARLPWEAMWRLPDEFWLALRNRIDEAKGLNAERVREVRAARIGELVKLLVEVA